MSTRHLPCGILASLLLLCPVLPGFALSEAEASAQAKTVLAQSGVRGGFVVHVGSSDGRATAALKANDSYQVQGLDTKPEKVTAAREFIFSKGAYGPVTVETFDGQHLPYIENFVNLVVVEEGQAISPDELDRVLAPNGVAMVSKGGQWQKTTKARPKDIDDWTHYYHDASGNAVAHDTVVGPPVRMQWLGSPRWSRHHDRMASMSAAVSTNGRLLYIMDEGSRISILLPAKFMLIARDAFNGTVLWKKPIDKWMTNMWPLKSGPTQLTRRLVGIGDKAYVTLGIDAPVSCLDTATGEVLRTYESTKGAEEILVADGVMYVLMNKEPWVLTEFAPLKQSDQQRVSEEYSWDHKPRILKAIEPETGKVLWEKEGMIAPITLAVEGKHLAYHDGNDLVCLDPVTGKEKWNSGSAGKRKLFEFNYGPRVIVNNNIVLYAGGDGAMKGYDAETGKELWTAPHDKSGYRSPEDLILTGGLVWNAPTSNGNMSGAFTGRDPSTGEVKKTFPPDIDAYWFHHRCYIAKATDNFIIPSRTGIEFVDFNKSHWNINHWVRGACLYGIIPCNGLTYAGPHDCACYPEAKLFGMNALAPKAVHELPPLVAEEARLERGPAYDDVKEAAPADAKDWPTYRHDSGRSGFTSQDLGKDLPAAWEVKLSGRLSALTVAGGKVFVSQIDAHTVHAIDSASGKEAWHFIAGSRVDSPPTYWNGRVLFGCMDGRVYCLRARDGALVWRFHAAPREMRHMAFEQLESVWPVHGSVLVENDAVSFVSGRSCFLDGGMRFMKLDAASGKKLIETIMDEKDPDSGKDLQMLHKTLQMPVALNDILSSDGKYTYLRSQKFDATGKRLDIAPVSGNAAEQGAAQKGEGAHIFAPMGYVDDEWFHRSYWVYGKHFAGGHNGYYQAGKYAPAGRILVYDDKNVYSYGRESQYYKWTTTMEHTLFSTSKTPPDVEAESEAPKKGGKKGAAPAAAAVRGIKFPDADALNPGGSALTVELWVLPDEGGGTLVSHGGPQQGYALTLKDRKPAFHVRSNQAVVAALAKDALPEGWHHVAGVLGADKTMKLYVDGQVVAEATAKGLLTRPKKPLTVGSADGGVCEEKYEGYTGLLDQLVIHHRALSADDMLLRVSQPEARPKDAALVCSFDNGDSRDESGHASHGVTTGVETGKGKVGAALWFRNVTPAKAGKGGKANAGSFVEHSWDTFVPIVTRAMALAGRNLFVAGPPDTLDEEYAFERMAAKDKAIQYDLEEQDAALDGKRGAKLWTMNVDTGEQSDSVNLDSPPVWDGMCVAQGRLFVATVDGHVKCFGK